MNNQPFSLYWQSNNDDFRTLCENISRRVKLLSYDEVNADKLWEAASKDNQYRFDTVKECPEHLSPQIMQIIKEEIDKLR